MKRIPLYFTIIAVGLVLSLHLPAEVQANGCFDWSGTWEASTGVTMELTKNGNSITGTFSPNNGQIEGTLYESDFVGTWSRAPTYTAPEDAGSFEISLAGTCNSFTGRWRRGYSHHEYPWQSWSGTRQGGSGGGGGSSPPSDPPPGEDPPPDQEPPSEFDDEEWGIEVRVSEGTASVNGQNRSNGSSAEVDCGGNRTSCNVQVESQGNSNIELYVICVENAQAILAIQLLLFADEKESSESAFTKYSFAYTAARAYCRQRHLNSNAVSSQQSELDVQIELERGGIELQGGASGLSLQIETPSSVISTSSTSRVTVAHDPSSGETYVSATSGLATVNPKGPGSTETVSSGEEVLVTDNGIEPAAPPSSAPPSNDPPPSDNPPTGSGDSLESYDANNNNRLDDPEFFSMLDGWIAQQISDALFFDGVDAWIGEAPVAAVTAASNSILPMAGVESQPSRAGSFVFSSTATGVTSLDLEVFDLQGNRISQRSADGNRLVWRPSSAWTSSGVANGVYLYRITQTSFDGKRLSSEIGKLTVLR